MAKPRTKKWTIPWLKAKLAERAKKLKTAQHEGARAQKKSTLYAIDMGHHLRAAQKLLAILRERCRKEGDEEPPTWTEWVNQNFDGSLRTAERYIELANAHDKGKFNDVLNVSNLSQRKLFRILKPVLAAHEHDRQHSQPTAFCAAQNGEQAAQADREEGRLIAFRRKLQAACQCFRQTLERWTPKDVQYLVDHEEMLDEPLRGLLESIKQARGVTAKTTSSGRRYSTHHD